MRTSLTPLRLQRQTICKSECGFSICLLSRFAPGWFPLPASEHSAGSYCRSFLSEHACSRQRWRRHVFPLQGGGRHVFIHHHHCAFLGHGQLVCVIACVLLAIERGQGILEIVFPYIPSPIGSACNSKNHAAFLINSHVALLSGSCEAHCHGKHPPCLIRHVCKPLGSHGSGNSASKSKSCY